VNKKVLAGQAFKDRLAESGVPSHLFEDVEFQLLAALPALADAPARLDDRVSSTHDLASMTAGKAQRLYGKVARYRVSLISDAWPMRKWDAYECAGDGVRWYSL
jgi:hypothetical protein